MKKKAVKLQDVKNLIEYKGDFYTPEELAEHLNVNGDFEILVHDEEDTWFGKAMSKLRNGVQ